MYLDDTSKINKHDSPYYVAPVPRILFVYIQIKVLYANFFVNKSINFLYCNSNQKTTLINKETSIKRYFSFECHITVSTYIHYCLCTVYIVNKQEPIPNCMF